MATALDYQSANSRINYPFVDDPEIIASPTIKTNVLVDFQYVDLVGGVNRVYLSRIVSVASTSITFYFTDPNTSTLLASMEVAAADAVSHIENTGQSFVSTSGDAYTIKMEFGEGIAGLISQSFDTTYTAAETEFVSTTVVPYTSTLKTLVVKNNYPASTVHTFGANAVVNLLPGANIDTQLVDSALSLAIVPRAGTGLFSNCEDLDPANLSTINGQPADSNGNFSLTFDQCYSMTVLNTGDLTTYSSELTPYETFSIPYQDPDTYNAVSVGHSFLVINNCSPKCAPANINAFADYMIRVQDGMYELYGAAVESDHTAGDFTATVSSTAIEATSFTSLISGNSGFAKYFHEGRAITLTYASSTQETTIVEVLDANNITVADALTGSGSATFLVDDEGLYDQLNDAIAAFNANVAADLVNPYGSIIYTLTPGTNEYEQYGTYISIVATIANPTPDSISYNVIFAPSGYIQNVEGTTKIDHEGVVTYGETSGTLGCKESSFVLTTLFIPCGSDTGVVDVYIERTWSEALSPQLVKQTAINGYQRISIPATPCDPAYSPAATVPIVSSDLLNYNIPGFAAGFVAFDETAIPAWMTTTTAIPPADDTYNLSGTPTETTVVKYLIASDVMTSDATTQVNTVIDVLVAPVVTAATVGAAVGIPFLYLANVTNSPTSWSASGLPSGVTVATDTGVFSGTPTATGTFAVDLTATNDAGSGSGTITIIVGSSLAAPAVTSSLTDTATTGDSFTYSITASNHPTRFLATGLPAGLSVNTSTGVISGIPIGSGTFSIPISASNSSGEGTATLVLDVSILAPVITSANTASATQGQSFSYTITATNGPTSFSASGLPAGLDANTSTGVISGIPTGSGSFSVTLGATNTAGTGGETLTLTVSDTAPVITSSLSVSFAQGATVGYDIVATHTPTSYDATGLPSGLAINTATGHITGSVSTIGVYDISITATNAFGYDTETLVLSIASTSAPAITSSSTASFNQGQLSSYQITATNFPTSYSSGTLPTGLFLNTSTGLIYGAPVNYGSSTVSIYATNGTGTGTITLTINVTQEPPVIVSSAVATGSAGSFSFQVIGSNSPTSYSASGLPGWASISGAGLITGTATTGTTTCTVSAANGIGTGNQSLKIIIS